MIDSLRQSLNLKHTWTVYRELVSDECFSLEPLLLKYRLKSQCLYYHLVITGERGKKKKKKKQANLLLLGLTRWLSPQNHLWLWESLGNEVSGPDLKWCLELVITLACSTNYQAGYGMCTFNPRACRFPWVRSRTGGVGCVLGHGWQCTHTWSLSSWEVEARPEVQGHPDPQKLETSLDDLRPGLKKKHAIPLIPAEFRANVV